MTGKIIQIAKAAVLLVVIATLAGASQAGAQTASDWTWVDGSSTIGTTCYSASYPCGQLGVYGAKGIFASANLPGSRTDAMSWTDTTGHKWLFGGFGYGSAAGALGELNDLWQSNAAGTSWEWVSGSNSPGHAGVYGTKGTAAAANIAGGRQDSVTWTDSIGNLWIFGGLGYDGSGTSKGYGYENDLWMYNPTTNQWTWEAGSSTVPPYTTNSQLGTTTFGSSAGVYGTQGVAAAANTPAGRTNAMAWTDASGNLWMFGGGYSNFDGIFTENTLYNDLWEFNTSSKQWTWQGGGNTSNAPGVYGTLGTAASSNIPGARYQGGSWKDPSGNFWLFGGYGYDVNGAAAGLDDLWMFNPTTQQWTWESGAKNVNTCGNFLFGFYACEQAGNYGTQGTAAGTNLPGARTLFVTWTDTSGNLWLFGGSGADSVNNEGWLNDLWKFSPSTPNLVTGTNGEWTWVGGTSTRPTCTASASGGSCGSPGVYGTLGTAASANMPGARQSAVSWTDQSGNFWLFGGWGEDSASTTGYLNDVWEYVPAASSSTPTAATPTFSVAGGSYSTAQTVTLSDGTSGATIYYTTNGTTPTTSSSVYSTAINVSSTETLEAIAVASGYSNSAVGTAAYTITQAAAATPTFSVAGGSYSSAQTVTLSDSTSGATIYYTSNGTTPTTSSSVYSTAITVSSTETLEAIAVASGYTNSAVATAAYTITQAAAATPTFSVAGGSYSSAQTVTLSDSTSGSTIYYTTNGTTPTTSSSVYSTAINVSSSETLEAIAVASGYTNSAVATAVYTITQPTAATPTFSVAGGSYSSAQTVTLSDSTSGSTIYYTTNGTTPTTSSSVYSTAINVSSTETLEAIAVASGYSNSAVATAAYTITQPTAATPTFSVAGGSYSSAQTVTLSDSTSGATIYYTTNGTTPTTNSSVYSTAIHVSSTETLEAIAVSSGFTNSVVATAAYTITLSTAATPTFSVAGGSYSTAQTVTLSDSTSGATIYYTTNGTTPTTSSSVYSTAISVSSTETLEAIAVASGYTNSAVATAAYTFTTQAATPAFSVAGGSYSTAQTVTLSDSTSGATIYYTTNGTTPTTSSSVYSTAITVSSTETVEAIAVASGYTNSAIATAAYTITTQAATPAFSVAGGSYGSAQTVTLSDATSGATIYYTTNGTTPTTSSSVYSSAISVSSSQTLEAIAVASGYTNSAVATAVYTITVPSAATPTFSVPGGNYSATQTVTLSDSTSGATIYYTTNGTTPTTNSSVYSAAISISSSETLEAIAAASGYTNSSVATAVYTITVPSVATPTFSVAGGNYSATQTVTLSDSTSGATVYYTTNGTTPTTSSTVYSTAINVSSSETLEAIAVASGSMNSAVATAVYTITPLTPSFTVTSPISTQTITQGSAATYTLSVSPQNGSFTSPITFSVSGLPPGATAVFNPTTVTPGSTAASITLTISTPMTALLQRPLGLPFGTRPITLAVLLLLFLPGKQHRRKLWLGLMLMVSIGATALLSGCGGGFALPGSASKTYNITVTAAGGSIQQTTTLQLTVKQ